MRVWREQKGAAMVEYVLILPMVALVILGTLEIFRLVSVKQSLRTGLKEALPCFTHSKDVWWADNYGAFRCDVNAIIIAELAKNPFTVRLHALRVTPDLATFGGDYGDVFEVTVEADVAFRFLYPFEGGPTITLRESVHTFADSSPEYYKLSTATPFPGDPGALP